jgi:Frag1/DRAM/Sfk1 family
MYPSVENAVKSPATSQASRSSPFSPSLGVSIRMGNVIRLIGFISTFTISLVYGMAILKDQIDLDDFLVSRAVSRDPSRAVASFGLPIVSCLMFLVFLAKYLKSQHALTSKDEVRALDRTCYWLAVIACFSFLGVQAISLRTHRHLHSVFALSLFTCSLLASLLSVIDDRRHVYGKWNKILLFRAFLVGVGCVCMTLMGGMLYLSRTVSSICEVTMCASYITFIISYFPDLKSYKLTVTLNNRKS